MKKSFYYALCFGLTCGWFNLPWATASFIESESQDQTLNNSRPLTNALENNSTNQPARNTTTHNFTSFSSGEIRWSLDDKNNLEASTTVYNIPLKFKINSLPESWNTSVTFDLKEDTPNEADVAYPYILQLTLTKCGCVQSLTRQNLAAFLSNTSCKIDWAGMTPKNLYSSFFYGPNLTVGWVAKVRIIKWNQ